MNKTTIPWADFTWNPITGCTKGCDYCYARKVTARFGADPLSDLAMVRDRRRAKGEAFEAVPADGPFPVGFCPTTYEHRLKEPLHRKKPAVIFLGSMGDLFDPAFSDEFRDKVISVVGAARQHTFVLLTKQPEGMRDYLRGLIGNDAGWARRLAASNAITHGVVGNVWPLFNLWLGVTVTNQTDADERIPLLLDTPAAHRFVSMEPMLGAVELGDYLYEMDGGDFGSSQVPLDAVIVGGKTPGHPLHDKDWGWYRKTGGGWEDTLPALRSLRDQCLAAGVPFHYKHGGTNPPLDGVVYDARPGDVS